MEWKWACKICNNVFDDTNALIQHYLKEHRAGINYGIPLPIDLIPPLKEQPKAKKLKTRQYEPVETEDELPEEAEEEPEEAIEEYRPKKKPKDDEGFEDLRLE